MTAAEMDIIIGANVDEAIAAFKKLGYQIQKVENDAEKFTKKAGTNFTGLSRVIQDLPFGFIAISNNLEQLLPAAGGLGLAFSAIVATLSFMQIGFQNWTRSSKAAKEASDEFAKSLRSAEQGARATGINLQSFVDIARDNTRSLQERNYALEQANKLMGEHGDKLTLVNINTAAVTQEINKFTEALIDQAIAAKFADKIADLFIKQKEALKAVGPALDNYNTIAKDFNDISKVTVSGGQGGIGGFGNTSMTTKVLSSLKTLTNARQDYNDVTKELQQTTGTFNEVLGESVSLFGQLGVKAKETATKLKKEFKVPIVPFDIHAGRVTPLQDHSFDLINKEIGAFLAKHPLKPIVTVNPILTLGEQGKAAIDATFGLINQQIVNGFTALGESLGNAIAGAKNPFAPVLAVLSEGIKTIGKAYIEIGVQMLVAKQALKVLLNSPVLTIAAGIALVALGQILQAKSQKVKGFATGGVVTKPTLALVGEQGPERITPLGYEGRANNNWMNGEVIFNISGQNLRGILRRADQSAYNTF